MTETEARQFLNKYFNAALCEPGVDAYLSLLAPDAVLEDPVGTPPHRGHEAIGQFLGAAKGFVDRGDISVGEIFVCGNECAARWTMSIWTKSGKNVVLEGMGVFVFDEQGKLRHIREFWDGSLLREIMS